MVEDTWWKTKRYGRGKWWKIGSGEDRYSGTIDMMEDGRNERLK